jgi:hypothetical protein
VARRTVLVSDQSGETIPDGKGATVRITYTDTRRGAHSADLTDAEAAALVNELGAKAVARRGRKPKAA